MNTFKLTRSAIIELLVSKLIAYEPLPVVELALKLKKFDMHVPVPTLYKVLQSLHQRGFMSRGYEELDVGPAHKCFQLTEAGYDHMKKLHDEWIRLGNVMEQSGNLA